MDSTVKIRAGAPLQVEPLTLHHVGFVVESIAEVGHYFARSVGARWDGKVSCDPLQEADVAFLWNDGAGCPMIELVQPSGSASPLHRFLKRGGGLHHLCYEVDSLQIQLESSRLSGALIVKPPLPAVAFGGRCIAWVYTRQKLLLEYLER